MSCRCSAGIPTPVSQTSSRMRFVSAVAVRSMRSPPVGMAWTAFVMRLSAICRIALALARQGGIGPNSVCLRTPDLLLRDPQVLHDLVVVAIEHVAEVEQGVHDDRERVAELVRDARREL